MKAVPEKNNAEKSATAVLEHDDVGSVKIHENVIAQLVRRAVLDVEGVSRLAGSALVDDIASLVGSRRMQSRAVAVVLGEEGTVAIEAKVVLMFGYTIPEVAAKIQTAVIELVENTTGMSVTKVDVLVQEIDDPEEEAGEEEAEANGAAPAMPLN
ncbi:MAG: Asp23/Gls24 family envelope stress response protein [Lentisphaeria bacterium]|nr:Asp23/Gls24 family envelope stress response protein [Lentisphaeria bacterium]MBQ7397177.1 Asp23/Gls24 family envelope stress response protein [Lentisphaeria bacterium]MBR7120006.1 Asp23/Gls24 family envelope stress response protein [Lentisphaeria bacterium]